MAVAINTPFSNLYLSAMLPERVSFSVQDENTSAVVSVYVDHQIVFQSTLYAFGHNMYLNDIRSIIEEGIRQNENAHGECMVTIADSESNASTQNFVVLISDFAIPSPMYFLATHFLTTRSSFRIHRSGNQTLAWLPSAAGTHLKYIDAVILPEGESTPTVLRWDQGQQQYFDGQLYSYTFKVQTISDYFEQKYPEKKGKLLSFTVHVGQRSMTFFVTDEVPDFRLSFLNAFNITEYAELYAVTTQKQKVERSEAHCNFDHIFYDQKTEISFEVETAALPYEEAQWLNQVFASRYVAIPIYGDTFEQILITDSTSEITDSDKEQNRLKFTYKFAKDKQHKYVESSPAYFTEEYNKQFM